MSATPPSLDASRPVRRSLRLLVLGLAAIIAFLIVRESEKELPRVQSPRREVERGFLTLVGGRLQSGETLFSGLMVERYPDRSLMSRSEILAGRMHGVSEGWFTNGALQVREHFEQGISHGLRIRWNEHGTKVAEARIVSGKIEGMFRRWHDNGVLAEELAMVHGEPEGVSRAWYPSGHLKAVVQMSGGAQVSRMDYADGEVPRIASR